MCFGGGGNAAAAAAQQQANQQQNINQNVNSINDAFQGRQGQYNDYLKALNTSYQSQLATQQGDASRGLKFALARNGQTGGSVAADQGGELQKEEGQGEITAAQQAQAKLAGLKSSDQAERQQLISLAQSGANVGNAGLQTADALSANLEGAQKELGPNTLGNIFGGVANSISGYNTAAQQRLGLRAAQAYTGPFSNSTSTNAGYTGPK